MSIIPYDEEDEPDEVYRKISQARKHVAQIRKEIPHNHFTRDIKPKGECPACDKYHDKT